MHPVAGVGGPGSHFEDKHSLDSDEKENDDEGSSKYDMLASEDVEGELYQELTFCWTFPPPPPPHRCPKSVCL